MNNYLKRPAMWVVRGSLSKTRGQMDVRTVEMEIPQVSDRYVQPPATTAIYKGKHLPRQEHQKQVRYLDL